MTDQAAAVVWAADYLPFGEVDVTVGTVENNLRFAGQYYDSETGLHYNYHRYYDPKLGRYLRADPYSLSSVNNNGLVFNRLFENQIRKKELLDELRGYNANSYKSVLAYSYKNKLISDFLYLPQRQNAYSYVHNNPINLIDSTGYFADYVNCVFDCKLKLTLRISACSVIAAIGYAACPASGPGAIVCWTAVTLGYGMCIDGAMTSYELCLMRCDCLR
jgi:RHS repeat-associated protein